MAQPAVDTKELHVAAHAARRDVKRLAGATRQAVRSLAQLEERLNEFGIGLDIQDNSTGDAHVRE